MKTQRKGDNYLPESLLSAKLENPEHGPMPGICCSCDERRAADSIHFTAFSVHVTDPLFNLNQVLIRSRGSAPRNAGPQIGSGGPECCAVADVRGSLLPACLLRSIVIQTQSHFHVLTAATRRGLASRHGVITSVTPP